MFYGLSNFFKNILPKRLFYRALFIVAIPVIVLQLVIPVVFFDSLWIKTNKGMTRALSNEIKFFFDSYENDQYNRESLTELFSKAHNIKVQYIPNKFYLKMIMRDGLVQWIEP